MDRTEKIGSAFEESFIFHMIKDFFLLLLLVATAEMGIRYAVVRYDAIQDFNTSSEHPLNIRIGISSGAAVAGIIGKTKFLYDLWGDVVNTASRMESHGTAGRIQISDATRQALIHPFSLEHRGVIEVKGKGEMSTWFLNSPVK